MHKGSVTFNDIIEVARIMRPRSCARTLAGTCKEILGSAVSVGCKVDHKHPHDIMQMVSVGEEGGGQGSAWMWMCMRMCALRAWACVRVFCKSVCV